MSVAIDITKFKNFKNKEWTPRQASITNQSRCKIDEGKQRQTHLMWQRYQDNTRLRHDGKTKFRANANNL